MIFPLRQPLAPLASRQRQPDFETEGKGVGQVDVGKWGVMGMGKLSGGHTMQCTDGVFMELYI